jgi:hypothetical protein
MDSARMKLLDRLTPDQQFYLAMSLFGVAFFANYMARRADA